MSPVVLVLLIVRPLSRHRRAASGRWSCCGKEDPEATGCAPRPHKPKEIMISVRADGAPPVLVGDTEVRRGRDAHFFYSFLVQLAVVPCAKSKFPTG